MIFREEYVSTCVRKRTGRQVESSAQAGNDGHMDYHQRKQEYEPN